MWPGGNNGDAGLPDLPNSATSKQFVNLWSLSVKIDELFRVLS